jgi:hypothetical protein
MAHLVADLLEKHRNITIDRKSLELGAVYPDLHLFRRLPIHNVEQLYKNYYMQTNHFINRNNDLTLSFSLGMMSHYVCDTFCMPHNKKIRRYRDFKDHVAYEFVLADEIEQFKMNEDLEGKIYWKSLEYFDFHLETYVTAQRIEYFKQASEDPVAQAKADIDHAVQACFLVLKEFLMELERAECPVLETIVA